MVAVPNIFTRNQLENRFRSDIENLLSGYFGRAIQLAVIVDESLKPADEDFGDEEADDETSEPGHATVPDSAITRTTLTRATARTVTAPSRRNGNEGFLR